MSRDDADGATMGFRNSEEVCAYGDSNTIESLRQQLASSNGHNIMLRNAIKPFAEGCWSRDLQTQAREALAATEPK